MSYKIVVQNFLCFADFLQASMAGTPGMRVRLLKAFTAADAIAQAELALRRFPGATLRDVKPYEEELAHFITDPNAHTW